jgi:hypothetical protein
VSKVENQEREIEIITEKPFLILLFMDEIVDLNQ